MTEIQTLPRFTAVPRNQQVLKVSAEKHRANLETPFSHAIILDAHEQLTKQSVIQIRLKLLAHPIYYTCPRSLQVFKKSNLIIAETSGIKTISGS